MPDEPIQERSFVPQVRLDREKPYLRVLASTAYVRDQDASIRFFVDKLGFSVLHDREVSPGFRWVAVSPPDGEAFIGLISPKPGSEEYKLIGHGRGISFVAEDVAARYREWSARGVHFVRPPSPSPVGGLFAVFTDPDGNGFALLGFDDVTREIEERRRVLAEKIETERRNAHELEIARQVQSRLFPQMLPPIESLDYAGVCVQACAVGGDYYDFLDLGPGRLGLVIGDVAGKGIAAALLMANLQANLRSQSAVAREDPERMLEAINRLFFENSIDSAYATLIFAEYDEPLRRLRYINCGHLPALILRGDGFVDRLHSTSSVLGLTPAWDSAVEECQLAPGDVFVLYTDGVTEAASCETGEEFGEDRLIAALKRHREQPAPEMLASLTDEVQRFCPDHQQDDITLMVFKCK